VKLKELQFEHAGSFRLRDDDLEQPTIVMTNMRPFADILATSEHKRRAEKYSPLVLQPESDGISTSSDSSIASFCENGLYGSWYEMYKNQLHEWYHRALNIASKQNIFHKPKEDPMTNKVHGAYQLYSIMLKYFPYAPGTKDQYPGKETFVLSQTDFNPQNIFVDDDGNVTGFIDWDFTDTKPGYIGWARQPVWLCEDWDSELSGAAGIGPIAWPDRMLSASCELERYRKDYARYLMEACGKDTSNDDWRFALKCHLFDAICVSLGRTKDMLNLLIRILDTHIGNFDWEWHLIHLGRHGFKPGLEDWYHGFFKKLLDCDPQAVRAELGMMNVTKELRLMTYSMQQSNKAHEDVQRTQREVMEMYQQQLAQGRQQIEVLQQALARGQRLADEARRERRPKPSTPPGLRDREQNGRQQPGPPSPDISWYEWNENEEYVMSGALRPLTPDQHESPSHSLLESPKPTSSKKVSPWERVMGKVRSCLRRSSKVT
jgi:hypothetical protein